MKSNLKVEDNGIKNLAKLVGITTAAGVFISTVILCALTGILLSLSGDPAVFLLGAIWILFIELWVSAWIELKQIYEEKFLSNVVKKLEKWQQEKATSDSTKESTKKS